ncbi:PepSY-like domain-containing protein [Polaribacter glomeratus]|uniref:Putative beta-lactamase-inhibitor-like PepSY-like domain-containing protein n=1 Tax=Polaribacter glomeratus TaxID=102 RepID=A0A2S7WUA2_9FLAO|nr:PepSY-like domain-containing protein [Polaribacter glomeratus]PQJ81174.1 hypothetical protein BTO16_00595 [Polaribacter glomeratus]TXD65730.1 hypothetical protein ESX12_08860 [Polaribacter glomeratus]
MTLSIGRFFRSEKSNINSLVLSSFNSKFPRASNILWQQIDVFKWNVSFTLKKKKHIALFNSRGKWLETVEFIPFNKIPKQLQLTIEKEYTINKLQQICYVQNPSKRIYEVNLNKDVFNIKVLFDNSGKTLGRILL